MDSDYVFLCGVIRVHIRTARHTHLTTIRSHD